MQNITNGRQEVTITDIKMPFWSMVMFMIKWAIATIPAMILLYVIGIGLIMLTSIILAGVRGALGALR